MAGADVTVIEREAAATHKICGEFLSIEAQSYLQKIGFDVAALGGHPIHRLRLARGDRCIETSLPFRGLGITRRTIDEALLTHAGANGAKLMRGRGINSVDVADGISLHLSDGEILRPETLFLATGKHNLRGLPRRTQAGEDLVGFKMYFLLTPTAQATLSGYVTLILLRGGYAGLQLVEGQQANLCLLVKRERFQQSGGKWQQLLDDLCRESSYLRLVLDGASATLPQPLTIYRVPYGFVHRSREGDPQTVFRLGDQAAVIPSFTGDGMSIALHSAALASEKFLRGEGARIYHTRLADDVATQISRAGLMYRAASAPSAGRLFFQLIRALPGSLKYAAELTRIPERARLFEA
jgi:2-polyprenyl-6-methoxyphenol hydroxylase-like FAD-dependent oxidoreductase